MRNPFRRKSPKFSDFRCLDETCHSEYGVNYPLWTVNSNDKYYFTLETGYMGDTYYLVILFFTGITYKDDSYSLRLYKYDPDAYVPNNIISQIELTKSKMIHLSWDIQKNLENYVMEGML